MKKTIILISILFLIVSCTKTEKKIDKVSGACPQCKKQVTGILMTYEGKTSDGTPVELIQYEGSCKSCNIDLLATTLIAGDKNNVRWFLANAITKELKKGFQQKNSGD